jgi:hypothetical protein
MDGWTPLKSENRTRLFQVRLFDPRERHSAPIWSLERRRVRRRSSQALQFDPWKRWVPLMLLLPARPSCAASRTRRSASHWCSEVAGITRLTCGRPTLSCDESNGAGLPRHVRLKLSGNGANVANRGPRWTWLGSKNPRAFASFSWPTLRRCRRRSPRSVDAAPRGLRGSHGCGMKASPVCPC